jgi:nucleoside-diphosphate-sugar epimerase
MTPLKALFIGGTGEISAGCSHRAVEAGIELFVLNRGTTSIRPLPPEVRRLHADVRDPESMRAALGDHEFDAVANFLAFTPEHIRTDLELFAGRTGQYVFISSASTYQKPVARLPIVESTPLRNPVWPYSQAKIACEDVLVSAYRRDGFPVTIVRPSHTYDHTSVPCEGGWTVIERMRRGQEIVVHGDGTSLWTLTHHKDFAKGFVGLLGHPQAIGDSFHITSDEVLTWNQIHEILAAAAGTAARIVHVPSDAIFAEDERWGRSLLGDKAHSVIFDNAKLRALVPDFTAAIPFFLGAREIVAWHDAESARRRIDAEMDALIERLASRHRPSGRAALDDLDA